MRTQTGSIYHFGDLRSRRGVARKNKGKKRGEDRKKRGGHSQKKRAYKGTGGGKQAKGTGRDGKSGRFRTSIQRTKKRSETLMESEGGETSNQKSDGEISGTKKGKKAQEGKGGVHSETTFWGRGKRLYGYGNRGERGRVAHLLAVRKEGGEGGC